MINQQHNENKTRNYRAQIPDRHTFTTQVHNYEIPFFKV